MRTTDDRLNAIERRIDEHAARGPAPGLTEPDPGADERWEATQVWAHMAEFVDYWREQAELIIGRFDGEPVPFGRVKTDAGRIDAIETGRRLTISELAHRTKRGLHDLRGFMGGLAPQDRAAVGRHVSRGEMAIPRLIDHFLIDHMEEHLDQLDALAEAAKD